MIKRGTFCFGFTLVETLVVLMIGAMVVTATLAVYQRVRTASVVIVEHMSEHRLSSEILQKMAEDIDRLAAPGFEATIKFDNRQVRGSDMMYQVAELVLNNSYYGTGDKKQVYEEIIWRAVYDPVEDTVILWRKHSGLNGEDRLFDQANAENVTDTSRDKSRQRFIPIASEVTFFDLRVQQGEQVLGAWKSEKLPKAVRIGLSFAAPQELEDGSYNVADEDIVYRTVAVDRTRMIPYQLVKAELDLGILDDETDDPNDVSRDSEMDTESETDNGKVPETEADGEDREN
jgi:prepilin-type N-terminal cleavage/methylation domain-containing protein